jgi:general secretion pathway protein G
MLKNFRKRIKRFQQEQKGFTLTEMLIVIALIALIGSVVTGTVIGRYQKSKVDSTKIQMKQLGTILDGFKLDCGFYPLGDQGLESLLHKPAGRECKNYNPDGYISNGKLPKDGFGNDFLYESDGTKYVIKSLGNDGQEGGQSYDADLMSNEID